MLADRDRSLPVFSRHHLSSLGAAEISERDMAHVRAGSWELPAAITQQSSWQLLSSADWLSKTSEMSPKRVAGERGVRNFIAIAFHLICLREHFRSWRSVAQRLPFAKIRGIYAHPAAPRALISRRFVAKSKPASYSCRWIQPLHS